MNAENKHCVNGLRPEIRGKWASFAKGLRESMDSRFSSAPI